MKQVKRSELKLGDIVQSFEGSYDHATVKQIKSASIVLFRPYVHTSDFSHSGGVICYIGFEEYEISINDIPITLIEKGRESK